MLRQTRPLALSLALLGASVVHAEVPESDIRDKAVYGHIEQVRLADLPDLVPARLDTGAQRSSLSARDVEIVERDETSYVRFTFVDAEGKQHEIERPLVEETRVRQASGEETRYVVSLPLCVGDRLADVEFTLTDRSGMRYPMLVGRNFLSEHALVSSAHRNTLTPAC
ncbi:ATP-dependent zinc protease family protein [Isoalcanivorax indicus]|uniref:ATP-dependent zinc protease family protein n=1 Tax=Isoalcanivorax indicus TaxID=2202653 RepID=UPI000DB9BE58|nr:RimK/LysX family protein [Isoalcanivorax indicus]